MKRINKGLDLVKDAMGLETDRELAKALNVTPAAVSSWRSGTPPGRAILVKISAALAFDFVSIEAWFRVDAEKDPQLRQVYQDVIARDHRFRRELVNSANQLELIDSE